MKRSYIADSIVQEYKRKQAYKNKQRQQCKDKQCVDCKYNKICIEQEEKNV